MAYYQPDFTAKANDLARRIGILTPEKAIKELLTQKEVDPATFIKYLIQERYGIDSELVKAWEPTYGHKCNGISVSFEFVLGIGTYHYPGSKIQLYLYTDMFESEFKFHNNAGKDVKVNTKRGSFDVALQKLVMATIKFVVSLNKPSKSKANICNELQRAHSLIKFFTEWGNFK